MCKTSADVADADSMIPALTNTHRRTRMHAFHCTFLAVTITLSGCALQNYVCLSGKSIMIFFPRKLSQIQTNQCTGTHIRTPTTTIIVFEIQTHNHGSSETGKGETWCEQSFRAETAWLFIAKEPLEFEF